MTAPTVQISKPLLGKPVGLCGVRDVHFHGGPLTATCKRCLAHPIVRDWNKNTGHSSKAPVRGCWCEACADGRYQRRRSA